MREGIKLKSLKRLLCVILVFVTIISNSLVVLAEDGDGGVGGVAIKGGELLPVDTTNPVNCGQIHQPRPIRKAFRFSHWSVLMDWGVLKTAF